MKKITYPQGDNTMALTKKEIHEQLILLTLMNKSCKIINKFELPKDKDMLTKIMSIGLKTLLMQSEISYNEIEKVVKYYCKNNDLIFNSNAVLIPLTLKEKTLSLFYEDNEAFFKGKFDLFFDFIFNLQDEIKNEHKIDILVTLSREFHTFIKQSGFLINKDLVLTDCGKKRINANTWNSLHDEQFDLLFDVLTTDTTFYDVHELFYYALEELDKIPKQNDYNIFFEEDEN